MSQSPGQPSAEPPADPRAEARERTADDVMFHRVERKRERIRAEIQRNRAGNHKVPTWVLAVLLAAIIAGWLYVILTA
jgi:hypothetical protein